MRSDGFIVCRAVMEHAYYASFGYQITSFFAASSRYGKSSLVGRVSWRAESLPSSQARRRISWSSSTLLMAWV